MTDDRDDTLFRAAYAPARALEPTAAEIAAVLGRVESARRRPRRRSTGLLPASSRRGRPAVGWARPPAIGLAAILLVVVALYSVPTTRAALEDAVGGVGGVFSGWLAGDHADAPGKLVGPRDGSPVYLDDHNLVREPRVIAEAGGYKLFAYREPSGGIGFDLGETGFAMGFENVGQLEKGALQVLGPGAMGHADRQGHVPLFGIAAREVKTVELTYETGPPLVVEGVDGGFVLLAEPARGPKEVLALDAGGEVLGRRPVDSSAQRGGIDWQRYLAR